MRKFTELREEISQGEFNQIERFADRLFAKVGIDVEFTRHFLDRVNDARNKNRLLLQNLQDCLSKHITNMEKNSSTWSRC